jgi:soluble lytic murein transglycosylase-like protein
MRLSRLLGILFGLLGLIAGPRALHASDLDARGNFVVSCIEAAAEAHRLPPAMLVVLINVEGGSLGKVNSNANATVDIGPMQVNQIWLDKLAKRWRASREETYRALRDEVCANIEGGAWILRQALDEARGDFWEGVALYHSHNEPHKTNYLRKVLRQVQKLQKIAAQTSQSPILDQSGAQ